MEFFKKHEESVIAVCMAIVIFTLGLCTGSVLTNNAIYSAKRKPCCEKRINKDFNRDFNRNHNRG